MSDDVLIVKAPPRRYLRLASVCEMMDASRRHVENLIETRKLRAFRPSKKMVLVPLDDVIRYVEGEKAAATQTA